ncbi:hypothetical protein ACP6PL_28825 [Dapis sp. BLCC M126]|uniref:hypothetical protein n=1 Tax=Dapis sp. BLCC M126 TaxID=3400189 RepID=UPI003CF04FA0
MTLLQDLADDEWIYWCMDDYYLIDLKEKKVNQIYEWVKTITDPSICAILYNRCGALLSEKHLNLNNTISSTDQQIFIERKNLKKIWNHQFLRVKVLRYLFENFPEGKFDAHETDKYKDNLEILLDQRLYVSQENLLILGESTRHGKYTMNCIDSLKKNRLNITKQRDTYQKNYRFQGRFLSSKFDLIRILTNRFF